MGIGQLARRPRTRKTGLESTTSTVIHSSPKVSSSKPYPAANCITCNKFSLANMCYMAVITKIVEPRFFHEAVKDSNWKEAMIKEIDALKKNNT